MFIVCQQTCHGNNIEIVSKQLISDLTIKMP